MPQYDAATLRRITSLIDYTRLVEHDDDRHVETFLQQADTVFGPVAAVCVYPQYVALAKQSLMNHSIKIASVANFPTGSSSVTQVLATINTALEDGADEIDVVFPYHLYLAGEQSAAVQLVRDCKAGMGSTILKVILETGALADKTVIAKVSREVLYAGADFIKTSTGKIAVGATPEAVETMLAAIIAFQRENPGRTVGIKVSGGVKTIADALQYIALADQYFGLKVTANHFRIGASQLLGEINTYGTEYGTTVT